MLLVLADLGCAMAEYRTFLCESKPTVEDAEEWSRQNVDVGIRAKGSELATECFRTIVSMALE